MPPACFEAPALNIFMTNSSTPRMASAVFTPEELAEIASVFKLFGAGDEISVKQLGPALRALGQNPTDAELKDMASILDDAQAVDGNARTTITLSEFVDMLSDKFEVADTETELRRAFAVFDKDGDGSIAAPEVGAVMASLGEPLPPAEVEAMLREVAGAEAAEGCPATVTFEAFVRVVSQEGVVPIFVARLLLA